MNAAELKKLKKEKLEQKRSEDLARERKALIGLYMTVNNVIKEKLVERGFTVCGMDGGTVGKVKRWFFKEPRVECEKAAAIIVKEIEGEKKQQDILLKEENAKALEAGSRISR